jgi:hypothetical protein
MGDVVKLEVVSVGDEFTIQPDQVLEAAKTKYERVVVIGITPEGEMEVAGSHGRFETFYRLFQAMNDLAS